MKHMENETPRAPVPCPEMTDIRAEIDQLDRELVTLLARRQKQIERAGRAKPSRETIRDNARIEEVVSLVLSQARQEGLSEAIAEPLWRLLIELSIAHETVVYNQR